LDFSATGGFASGGGLPIFDFYKEHFLRTVIICSPELKKGIVSHRRHNSKRKSNSFRETFRDFRF
jgi:hypothetical protein